MTEGFLILVDPATTRHFDLQFFIRADYDTLKDRRIKRQGYVSFGLRLSALRAGLRC